MLGHDWCPPECRLSALIARAYHRPAMRILHLAWEYPPVLYGGLGRHVHALAHAQAEHGHDVIVITQAAGAETEDSADREPLRPHEAGSVRVLRTGSGPMHCEPGDLLRQVAEMQGRFEARGARLLQGWSPQVVHAHDWMVGQAADAVRRECGAPLVATIHATEAGRNRGWIHTDLSTAIHAQEWWLANTADSVIACSRHMAAEVDALFGVSAAHVVPNGITPAQWQRDERAIAEVRAENADAGVLLAYTGRVEWEKGVQTLLDAMPRVLEQHPDARLLVAGQGSYLPALQLQAQWLGLGDHVRFLGWVSEERLRAVVAAADVALAPSLYEPFGLVALEAAALGTPLVVAETGGLAEFAADGDVAATFRAGDAGSLAWVLGNDLADEPGRTERARRASQSVVDRYSWSRVAELTVDAYPPDRSAVPAAVGDARGSSSALHRHLSVPHFDAPPGQLMDAGW